MNSSEGPTSAIANFVASTPDTAIPATVRERAVLTVVDTFATTMAGIGEDASEVARRALLKWAAPGLSTVAGQPGSGVDAPTAAALNGVAAHTLDYDNISFAVSGFVGSATVCALTALVEESDVRITGRDVITAYCFGWEGAAALARGINPLHYSKGWHPTSTMGRFSATLACCRLLGLDPETTASAISICVSEAAGVKTMIGNMLNPWHVGTGGRNGVVASGLAAAGFVGHEAALEADQGFLNLFNGPGNYDTDAIVSSLGNQWDLIDPGPIFKVYPCCGLIHSGLDAALSLRAEHDIAPGEIESVEVLVHEFVPRVMHIDVPDTGYASKFSIPYCTAVGLLDGRVDLASFDDVRPEVVELARSVSFGVHPDLHGGGTFLAEEFTEVTIKTARGSFTERVQRMENRGTGPNLVVEDLRLKFADCLRHGGDGSDIDASWERLNSLDDSRPWSYWDGS